MLKISPYRRSKQIVEAATLADAIHGCDTYALKVVPGKLALGLMRTARWRSLPATPSQRQFILKRWQGRKTITSAGAYEKAAEHEARLGTMTKGEAGNIITRLKHGAQVYGCIELYAHRPLTTQLEQTRYEKKQREKAKALRAITREVARRAREDVKVGPLAVAT